MRHQFLLANATASEHEQRQHRRGRVLLGAVVAAPDGANALEATIRDISARGAGFYSNMDLPIGAEIFLLDTRNHFAYLATIRWKKSDSAGVEFVRTYDLNSALPAELIILEKLLIEAKLRQIATLERRGVELEQAASIVGLTEMHFGKVDEYHGLGAEFGPLLHALLPLVKTGSLGATRDSNPEDAPRKVRFFQRRNQQ